MKYKKIILILLLGFTLYAPAHAEDSTLDLSLEVGSIRSKDHVIADKVVKIYATVKNNSKQDLLGTVKFYDETKGEFIGLDQPVSIIGGGTDDVFVDWNPGSTGSKKITARILPWLEDGDDSTNNKISTSIFVDIDSDQDGIPNQKDPDDDNDEVKDTEDAFPLDPEESLDTDGDGVGNNRDEDDDGDGVMDIQDLFPLDPKEALDEDGDGVGDKTDKFPQDPSEWEDKDDDGVGANSDKDDQNKGPIPIIKIDPEKILTQKEVEFDASASEDSDGKITNYSWFFGGDKEIEGVTIKKSFEKPGDYNVLLKVTDDKGEFREGEMTFTVYSAWKKPVLLVALGLILMISIGFFIRGMRKKKKLLSEKLK